MLTCLTVISTGESSSKSACCKLPSVFSIETLFHAPLPKLYTTLLIHTANHPQKKTRFYYF